MEPITATERRIVDAEALGQYLGLNRRAVLYFARQGVLPTVRIGRLVRFDLEQIDDWIRGGGSKLLGNWRRSDADDR